MPHPTRRNLQSRFHLVFTIPCKARQYSALRSVVIFVPKKTGNEEKGQETIECVECSNLSESKEKWRNRRNYETFEKLLKFDRRSTGRSERTGQWRANTTQRGRGVVVQGETRQPDSQSPIETGLARCLRGIARILA